MSNIANDAEEEEEEEEEEVVEEGRARREDGRITTYTTKVAPSGEFSLEDKGVSTTGIVHISSEYKKH